METAGVPLSDESKSKIIKFLELCIQPKNKKEMETIVSKFWKKYENFSGKDAFCEFHIACMYAFDYAYRENSECLAAVSRSVYAYLDQNVLALENENRNRFINCGNDWILAGLRKFENFDSEEGMDILVQSQISSLINGNVGFVHFLVKFGLVDFPSEANERSTKMITQLLGWFNISYKSSIRNVQAKEIHLDDLLNRMEQNEISFRRSMLIFCTICIISDYWMYEKLCIIQHPDLNLYASQMKSMYIPRMRCLDLYIGNTTEAKITFRDIDIFTTTVLNPYLGLEFATTLVETSKKIMSQAHAFYNPRSLKDLTRCKIRACVPHSTMLPEHVKQLTIPETLKEFISFHTEEFWELLKANHAFLHLIQLLHRRMLETQT